MILEPARDHAILPLRSSLRLRLIVIATIRHRCVEDCDSPGWQQPAMHETSLILTNVRTDAFSMALSNYRDFAQLLYWRSRISCLCTKCVNVLALFRISGEISAVNGQQSRQVTAHSSLDLKDPVQACLNPVMQGVAAQRR
jgi:hypothetical protein